MHERRFKLYRGLEWRLATRTGPERSSQQLSSQQVSEGPLLQEAKPQLHRA